MSKKILLLDNYDSFTYNIVQYLRELGHSPVVIENDKVSIAEIETMGFTHMILSPGPGHPKQAGISIPLIQHFANKEVPILGICLGHQAMAIAFGGQVGHAQEIHHGKVSLIKNNKKGLFRNLPETFNVTRYHSLVVKEPLSEVLALVAWHELVNGQCEVMALQHKVLPCFGVQFHPEAILTEFGYELLNNFCVI